MKVGAPAPAQDPAAGSCDDPQKDKSDTHVAPVSAVLVISFSEEHRPASNPGESTPLGSAALALLPLEGRLCRRAPG